MQKSQNKKAGCYANNKRLARAFPMPGKGITMPVKSYKDRNGKTKYYAAFYYSDYTCQRKKKKKEGFTTAAAACHFAGDRKT